MSKVIILNAELTGFLRNFAITYEEAINYWNYLGGKSESYPRAEDEFAQIFSVTHEGKKWIYAVDISRIYEDREEENNKRLILNLRKVVRFSERSEEFIFCGSPVRIFMCDGEIMGIGYDGGDVWLDMESFELTSQNELEMKVKKSKKARAFIRRIA